MSNYAEDIEDVGVPVYSRTIEIRIAEPAPRYRYEKGKPVKEPAPDMNRVIQAIEDELTGQLQIIYGEETQIIMNVSRAADIRLTGNFSEKATETRKTVSELLGNVMENLEFADD